MATRKDIKRPLEKRRLIKGVIVGAIIAAALIWIRSYALLLPLCLGVWVYISTYAFTHLASWVEDRTPFSKTLLSWSLAIIFGAAGVSYVVTFVFSLSTISTPDAGTHLCLVDKMHYGVPCDTANASTYYRTHKLGRISRGDMALVHTPVGSLALKVVARPGDTVAIADAALFVNGQLSDKSDRPTALFKLRPHTPYSVKRQMSEAIAKAGDKPQEAVEDTSTVRLPIARREDEWKVYTYATIFRNMDDDRIYPWNVAYQWNAYHWGPFRLPKQGDVISLSYANTMLYGPLTKRFEGTELKPQKGATYTFKLSYYMTLNNNRDVIADSRQFGPTPENHIISHIIKL